MNNMQSPPHLSGHRIGFVSTRFNSTDGVSLETQKWAQVLGRLGQSVYYFAGQSDQPKDISFVVPEAQFLHKDVQEIANISYRSPTRPLKITHQIHELRSYLKDRLYEFIKKYDLELLIWAWAMLLAFQESKAAVCSTRLLIPGMFIMQPCFETSAPMSLL